MRISTSTVDNRTPVMARGILITFLLFIAYVSCFVIYRDRPYVLTRQGIVRGTVRKVSNGREISAFLGIPFAEPPVGELRFKNPVPKKPWFGILDAVNDTARCPQASQKPVSEDCLYLHVYTPRNINPINPLPVMVFIYGGAFVGGSNDPEMYGPEYLLTRDVILVVPNYRVGIFGFLSTGDQAAPGNFGLKDQTAALRWVQQNIRAFGGDPNRVTLFGESAGAASVQFHTLSDLSNGLFHRYITQSGSALSGWSFHNSSTYSIYPGKIAKEYNCTTNTSTAIISCLRNLTVQQLLDVDFIFNTVTRVSNLTWGPTNEPPSKDAFLVDSPINIFMKNKTKDIPFITGVTRDEGLLFTTVLNATDPLYQIIIPNLRGFLVEFFQTFLPSTDAVKLTSEVIQFYFNGNVTNNKNVVLRQLTDFVTDIFFVYPQVITLRRLAKTSSNPFYFYTFEYRGSFSLTAVTLGHNEDVGVTHSDDLLYIFPLIPGLNKTNEDNKVKELMLDAWTSFAANGIPKTNSNADPNIWKPYTQPYTHLQIGNNSDPTARMVNTLHRDRIDFWDRNLRLKA